MNHESRLRRCRKAKRLSLEDVAERMSLSVSQISRIERGEREPTRRDLLALAGIYEVPVENLIDSPPVVVVGYVGAGTETILFAEGQGALEEVDRPPGTGSNTVAVVVRGDSMAGTADDNALLYYDAIHDPPTDELIGRLCVVGLADGRVLVKKLYHGRKPHRYDLFSTNIAPMQDQEVVWAARVLWIKPR